MWKSVTEGEKSNCASLGHVWSWLCLFPPFISCLFVLIFGLFAPSALYLVQSLVAYKGGGETGGEICRTNVYAFGFFFFCPRAKIMQDATQTLAHSLKPFELLGRNGEFYFLFTLGVW